MIYTDTISLHISNRPDILLRSILKYFFDIFVNFIKREVINLSLWNENKSGFRFINDNSKNVKKGKVA